jgi:hypothetical protein
MKIGIVTYHRTLNYGAVMQSLATRFILEEMGHEVYYVDYWPDYHKEKYALFPINIFFKLNLHGKFSFLLSLMKFYKSKKKRIENFEKFFETYIYPYCRSVDEFYDVVIYGSDQIWRKQIETGEYNPFYFGKNRLKTKYHISYAASMGILPDNDDDKEKVKKLVAHLDKISVREEGLRQLLLSLGCTDVTLSLDPTLLLSSEKWDKYLPTNLYKGKRFVLVYLLNSNPFNLSEVKKFADDKGLELVVLHGYARTKETKTNITSAGPYDFIRLIKNADYVFSGSFHGLAFSIIYGRQFYTSFKYNSERASSLLAQLGLSNRLIPAKSIIPQDLPQIDYKVVREKLMALRQESLNFLSFI